MTICGLVCGQADAPAQIGGDVVGVEEVLDLLGRPSFSTLKRWWKSGRFPQPIDGGLPGHRLA
jgi:hypothetical protein